MRRARTWLPAWLGARLRARRFGPNLASQDAHGDLPASPWSGFYAGLEGDGPPVEPPADPLVLDAQRELAKLAAAEAKAAAAQVDLARRQTFFGLVALGGAIVSPNPLPRRRRGAIARLIAALF
ncbi:hypothetical protein [Nitrospirillum amazonense]|uniref:hypothetical protein n=1 Tax=Nitrospirillum amazonense TaxID=28077 RepID=UPI0024122E8D|nr:hypothetical protein [Nitrospirillum amazonense]MDG3444507.1 hypothetical protein [Nitrospirillum amazonense]